MQNISFIMLYFLLLPFAFGVDRAAPSAIHCIKGIDPGYYPDYGAIVLRQEKAQQDVYEITMNVYVEKTDSFQSYKVSAKNEEAPKEQLYNPDAIADSMFFRFATKEDNAASILIIHWKNGTYKAEIRHGSKFKDLPLELICEPVDISDEDVGYQDSDVGSSDIDDDKFFSFTGGVKTGGPFPFAVVGGGHFGVDFGKVLEVGLEAGAGGSFGVGAFIGPYVKLAPVPYKMGKRFYLYGRAYQGKMWFESVGSKPLKLLEVGVGYRHLDSNLGNREYFFGELGTMHFCTESEWEKCDFSKDFWPSFYVGKKF